MKRMVFL